jgi:Protein of unknown function (DUF3106)
VGVSEKGAPGAAEPGDTAAARGKAIVRALLLCAWVLAAGTCLAQQLPVPAAAAPTPAQEPAAPRSWQSLSPQQQLLLQSFQGRWDSLPPDKQQALARGSLRWIGMSAQQRAGAQQRFQQWRALPPEQRQLIRQRWQQFRSLPPQEQQHIREQFSRFHQLPPERREQLRQQWRQMTPQQRRGFMQRPGPRGSGGFHRAPPAAGRIPR